MDVVMVPMRNAVMSAVSTFVKEERFKTWRKVHCKVLEDLSNIV